MKTNTAPTGENCIRAALLKARHSMDTVFALVPSNAWLDRPVPERHRLVFYLGHVEAFDWNLIRSELHLQSFQSTFDRLFAFGIDPKAGQLPDDVPSDWPSIKEISDYTALVRRRIDEVVHHIPPVVPHIAMEHRFVARNQTIAREPRLAAALRDLSGRLSDDTMRRLNHQVLVLHGRVEEVAHEFLRMSDLLKEPSSP